jgi:ABC-2 type transport system ATP-binding protein
MIEAQGLTKIFDGFRAVSDISLNIPTGKVLALLGPNGAGKTTTVRMLTSILAPTSGWARVGGYDILTQAKEVRTAVGVLTESHGLYERMKAMEYLHFYGEIYGMARPECHMQATQLMERFGLTFALGKRIGDYSKGMKQKLALVRAMLHNPPVLLLDEPTSAMDPQSAKQVRDVIEELQEQGRTFLLTTHNLTEAQSLADNIAVIRHGRIIASGTFEQLAQHFKGDPIIEIRTAQALNGARKELADVVNVIDSGDHWLHYRSANHAEITPNVLRKLMGLGVDVISAGPLPRTLEDVYLKIMQEDEDVMGAPKRA